MALFSSKKKTAEKKTVSKETVKVSAPKKVSAPVVAGSKDVLLRPRITEKAANMTAVNVYTFDVRTDATKKDIALAIKMLYKVTPLKVNVVNVLGKKVSMRRKRGFGKTASSRKAYVFLKKGDEIQFS